MTRRRRQLIDIEYIQSLIGDNSDHEDADRAISVAFWTGWLLGNETPRHADQSSQNMVHRDRMLEALRGDEPVG